MLTALDAAQNTADSSSQIAGLTSGGPIALVATAARSRPGPGAHYSSLLLQRGQVRMSRIKLRRCASGDVRRELEADFGGIDEG